MQHRNTKIRFKIPRWLLSETFEMNPQQIYRWSKTTLTYWMMVEKYLDLKEEAGGSIPNCEVSSPIDKKRAKW